MADLRDGPGSADPRRVSALAGTAGVDGVDTDTDPADVQTVNPATGQPIATHPLMDSAEVGRRVDLAWDRWLEWRLLPVADRAEVVGRIGEQLTARREELAQILTAEMGKPLKAALAEVDKSAAAVRYIVAHAPAVLADDPRDADAAVGGTSAVVRHSALGPLLGIMPWNFPYWQTIRFVVPAWIAGNVTLLKPAPETLGSAAALQLVFDSTGLPPGVAQTLPVAIPAVAHIMADPRIRGVSLTGSARAGRSVAALAGRHLTKVVLELGGSDAFLVLADADVDAAAAAAVASRMQNAGQSCIAAKRFLVHSAVADQFLDVVRSAVDDLVVGDPTDPAVTMGPLATEAARDSVHSQVLASVSAGARVAVGGHPIDRPGFFYEPTVLTAVTPQMRCAQEEVFGPVLAMSTFTDLDEAVATANSSPYGLAASVWTGDGAAADSLASRLEVGQVFVNAMVVSDPRYPFGGVKDSGFGRELGTEGFREFTNAKLLRVLR